MEERPNPSVALPVALSYVEACGGIVLLLTLDRAMLGC